MTNDFSNQSKEIDLIDLFKLIKQGLLKGLKGLIFLFVFGFKNIHWLSLIVISGGLIGYLFFSSTQKVYSSDLIAQTNGVSAIDIVQYINDLGEFTRTKNTKALATSLDLHDTIVNKIKSIEAFNYIDLNKDGVGDYIDFDHSYRITDTLQVINESRFYLQVKVYNNKAFASVKNGLNNYISKNSYLQQLHNSRKKELKDLIQFTENEFNFLDSLQKIELASKNEIRNLNSKELTIINEKEEPPYYLDKQKLLKKKHEYIRELEQSVEPISIIKDFPLLSVEKNTQMGYVINFAFWFGLIGYLILLTLKYRKKVAEFIQ